MKNAILHASALFIFFMAYACISPAQTFNTLVNFDGTNGGDPLAGLLQAQDGGLYGTTYSGGYRNCNGYSCGTIFGMNLQGDLRTLYEFCPENSCFNGFGPQANLVLGTDGNFYGTTFAGGTVFCSTNNGCGTVFKISRSGNLTTLHQFCSLSNCNDGYWPGAPLVQATDGNYYGTTYQGGTYGVGTVFRITSDGILTTLHSFDSTDGGGIFAGLIQATDGNLYGTTPGGGANKNGTVFKMTLTGRLTALYNFCTLSGCSDGSFPTGGLVEGVDGNLYGTTYYGRDDTGNCAPDGCGTVFQLTLAGKLTTLHSFDGVDGAGVQTALIQATDGNLYGVTPFGSEGSANGTVFKVSPSGAFATLHTFNGNDGAAPYGALVQDTNGTIYGTTSSGGRAFNGTVFSLSLGLGPFVSFVRNSGYVGQTGPILGQGFTGTTNVSLNGTSVPFTVKSDTLITATIPVGGTTGSVTVTTPTGTLTSNVPFRVLPQLLSFTPTSGPVGTQVTITGVSFTQTIGVGFGDYTPAPFAVNSDTQVTATVPTGAKTGPVGIQTQGGTAISTQTFTVIP